MKIFIKCEDANHKCDKSQYKEASFWEKVTLNIHLIYCAVCRKYSARNAKLTNAINQSKPKCIPKEQKELLKERLQKEMSK
jgi:predicted anti-sigma-YlaC factor YlaD